MQHFLDLWKKAEAVSFPEQGTFYKLELPKEMSESIDRIAKATGKKKQEIIDSMFQKGLEKLANENEEY